MPAEFGRRVKVVKWLDLQLAVLAAVLAVVVTPLSVVHTLLVASQNSQRNASAGISPFKVKSMTTGVERPVTLTRLAPALHES